MDERKQARPEATRVAVGGPGIAGGDSKRMRDAMNACQQRLVNLYADYLSGYQSIVDDFYRSMNLISQGAVDTQPTMVMSPIDGREQYI